MLTNLTVNDILTLQMDLREVPSELRTLSSFNIASGSVKKFFYSIYAIFVV